jgi:hypothetical protein
LKKDDAGNVDPVATPPIVVGTKSSSINSIG